MRRSYSLRCGALAALVCVVPSLSNSAPSCTLQAGVKRVERYHRIELTLAGARAQGNPFDADQVNFRLEITAPSGRKIELPAFYSQEYERRQAPLRDGTRDWLYPTGEPVWKARFAPEEIGVYTCRAILTDRSGIGRSNSVRFTSIRSSSPGFVRVSATDPRYLERSDGKPFFPIGQNIAFIKDSYQHADWIRRLAEGGGNYTRIWAACEDWGLSLEARKSAWGRSWEWNPPFTSPPDAAGSSDAPRVLRFDSARGAVDMAPSRPVALRPGGRYTLRASVWTDNGASLSVLSDGQPLGSDESSPGRWRQVEREIVAGATQWWLPRLSFASVGSGACYVKGLSLRAAGRGPELLWDADPNRPVEANYNLPDCYLLDKVVEAAEANGVYMQLVVLSRDLHGFSFEKWPKSPGSPEYEGAVHDARNLLRYAIARWGYSTSLAMWEYFNEMDPGAATDRFYAELGDYLAKADPYCHLRTTSAWGPSPKDWRHPSLDVADVHAYMRPVKEEPWKDEQTFITGKVKEALATKPRKPVFLAEYGLADEKWGLSPYIAQDTELQHIHNGLWASLFAGLSGSAMTWWWDSLDDRKVYRHYGPLAAFTADIPLTTAHLRPVEQQAADNRWRALGLQGSRYACWWVSNPDATYYRLAIDKVTPSTISGASLHLSGMAPGSYAVEWWDTYSGKRVRESRMRITGDADLPVPEFARDIACKIRRVE